MAATKNASGLFAARFFLGCFETGIGPSAVSHIACVEGGKIRKTNCVWNGSLLFCHSGTEEKNWVAEWVPPTHYTPLLKYRIHYLHAVSCIACCLFRFFHSRWSIRWCVSIWCSRTFARSSRSCRLEMAFHYWGSTHYLPWSSCLHHFAWLVCWDFMTRTPRIFLYMLINRCHQS